MGDDALEIQAAVDADAETAPPSIAIVGRPNVGKSTLFNRLVRRRKAITLDTPGITRDAVRQNVVWDEKRLVLIDTGGLGGEADIALADVVHAHTVQVMQEADAVVVLLDAKEGVGPLDRETVDLVVRSGRPALFVANKAEGRDGATTALEFCRLGIDPPLAVSAEHGEGIAELKEAILDLAASASPRRKAAPARPAGEHPVRVALVGKPNVGKSSFLNAVAGEPLSLVDDRPGTTRDVVDTTVIREGRSYVLLDTAGMRRPSRVNRGVERISVRRSLEAIERAHVVALLAEAGEKLSDQDARIARHAWTEGRALVLLLNKTDLLPHRASRTAITAEVRRLYPSLNQARVGFLSVKKEEGLAAAFREIDAARAAHDIDIPTATVNRVLAAAAERRDPPVLGRGRLRLLYGTQTAKRPPTITVFVNRVGVPTAYARFLERCLREEVDLLGTPVRFRFQRRDSHSGRTPESR